MTYTAFGLFAITVGVVAGLLFYGGLWLTVRPLRHMEHPALTVLGSLLIRMALTLALFYAVARVTGSLVYLGIALLCFFVVRVFVTMAVRPEREEKIRATES